MLEQKIYDVIGVGFGPANLALAISLEEEGFDGDVLFIERKSGCLWQDQMLISGADIQNNPLRDLVTPRNPRSRYSFTNFLFENDRLYEHLNLGLEFPLRREFAQYVAWVASFFNDKVQYNAEVIGMSLNKQTQLYTIDLSNGQTYHTRSLVVAPGRTPRIPQVFEAGSADKVFHLTKFRKNVTALAEQGRTKRFAVIGGSQSAIEIMLQLREEFPEAEIHNFQRGYSFRQKDTSQFSEHIYFPSFVDYYYDSTPEAKKRINRHLHYTNYSAADDDVIKELYVKMYDDKLQGKQKVFIHGFSEVRQLVETGSKCQLQVEEFNTHTQSTIEDVDCVILATGFKDLGADENSELCPGLLNDIYPNIKTNEQGVIQIARNYQLNAKANVTMPPLFLNGLCESSHGYGDAGSFSLLALRAAEISSGLLSQLKAVEAA